MDIKILIEQYLLKNELQNNLDYKTIKAYRIDLDQFNEFIKKSENKISKEIISEYIYTLKYKNYAIKTIKRKIASLKAFFLI